MLVLVDEQFGKDTLPGYHRYRVLSVTILDIVRKARLNRIFYKEGHCQLSADEFQQRSYTSHP